MYELIIPEVQITCNLLFLFICIKEKLIKKTLFIKTILGTQLCEGRSSTGHTETGAGSFPAERWRLMFNVQTQQPAESSRPARS